MIRIDLDKQLDLYEWLTVVSNCEKVIGKHACVRIQEESDLGMRSTQTIYEALWKLCHQK